MDTKNVNTLFLQLVWSLQAGAMQQMGKVTSPITGKVERDLEMARHSIDILAMLRDKMKGNLTDEEEKLIDHVLYELRLNYVDETKKGDTKPDVDSTKEQGKEDVSGSESGSSSDSETSERDADS